jgi:hypothetical protein
MAIGGFRFTIAARLLFDQNVQTYVKHGEVSQGPRPWPEPWILTYTISASCMMLAGSVGLLLKRRWGLTLVGVLGLGWAISALCFLLTSYRLFEKVLGLSLWERTQWHVEVGTGAVAIIVGLLLMTLGLRPRWAGFPEAGTRGPFISALVVWGLISLAISAMFDRWVFRWLT